MQTRSQLWIGLGSSPLNPNAFLSCSITKSCLTLCDPMDCSPLGFSVHGLLQARILETIAMPSSRGSSPPRDRTCASYVYVHWQVGSLPLGPPGTVQIHREVSYKYVFGWRQIMFTYILSWQGCGQIFCNEIDFFITVYANALNYLFCLFWGFLLVISS